MSITSLSGAIIAIKVPPRSSLYPPNYLLRRSQTHMPPLPPLRATHSIRATMKPSAIPRSPASPASDNDDEDINPFRRLAAAILKALQRPVDIVAVLLSFAMAANPLAAIAASGGCMGGSDFSSFGSSSSSDTSSSSYDTSSSWSSSSSYDNDNDSDDFSSKRYSFTVAPNPPRPKTAEEIAYEKKVTRWILVGVICISLTMIGQFLSSETTQRKEATIVRGVAVHRIQVGLLGSARTLQKDLERIAETADTSTPAGFHYVLTETALALLRHPDRCISAYSSVDIKRSIEEGEKRFNQLSIEERGKFDEETLVNVNNIRKKRTTSQSSNGYNNEYIVVTILVATEGGYKLPVINGSADLKEALTKLGSIPSNKTMAVQVLWTPQNENDTLTERELLEDYPLLRPL